MPLSITLQLAMVLACMPAVMLAILAGQLAHPAPVDSSSAFFSPQHKSSDERFYHEQKPQSGEDRRKRIAVADMAAAVGHLGHDSAPAPLAVKTATSAGFTSAKDLVLQLQTDQAHRTVKIDYDAILALNWLSAPRAGLP